MSAHPTEGSDGPEATDPVMSAVLSNRGRAATPLSPDEERLLDDWVAGRLAPAEAERAASLTRQNSLAAERVLERRLLEAARQSPPVPQEARGTGPEGEPANQSRAVRRLVAPARPLAVDDHRRRAGTGGDRGGGGRAVVAAGHAGRRFHAGRHGDDRRPQCAVRALRRSHAWARPAARPVVEQRFHDVDVPIGILKGLLAAAAAPRSAASREIEPYLSMSGDGRPAHVVVDSALKAKIEAGADGERMPVRIYDLEDPRAADIRPLVGQLPKGRRIYLLTLKP